MQPLYTPTLRQKARALSDSRCVAMNLFPAGSVSLPPIKTRSRPAVAAQDASSRLAKRQHVGDGTGQVRRCLPL